MSYKAANNSYEAYKSSINHILESNKIRKLCFLEQLLFKQHRSNCINSRKGTILSPMPVIEYSENIGML